MHEPQDVAPRQLVGHVLGTHPEAQSLFIEAGHWRALAERSAIVTAEAFTVMQAARLGYEELRHRLDPRRTRTVHFVVALALLTVVFAALVVLDGLEFAGVLAGWLTALAAIAAAAAWTGWAWLAALALRDRQHGRLAGLAAAAAITGLLLAILHGTGSALGLTRAWRGLGVGVLGVLLILALAAAAAVLIARTEPASLMAARRRWHRARDDHAAAVTAESADNEAAVIAGQGWRNLIEAQASASADGEVVRQLDQPT